MQRQLGSRLVERHAWLQSAHDLDVVVRTVLEVVLGEDVSGVQGCTSRPGKWNDTGITPTIVCGTPLRLIVGPTTPGLAPNCDCQSP